MKISEEQFRLAVREVAAEITDDSAPPLTLPVALQGSTVRRHLGWSRLVTPLAAAAAVIAVVAGSLAITGRAHPRAAADTASAAAVLSELPPYYIAINLAAGKADPLPDPARTVTIRSTRTGAALASVRAPRPYLGFVDVSGAAAIDRLFVLAAMLPRPARVPGTDLTTSYKLFFVSFDPARSVARLLPLGIPVISVRGQLSALALSPDGSQVAVAGIVSRQDSAVTIYLTGPGAVARTWRSPGFASAFISSQGTLSWSADSRTLAVTWFGSRAAGLRLLRNAGPGGSLITDSRLAVPARTSLGTETAAMLTPDGKKVIAAVRHIPATGPSSYEFAEFATATGHRAGILYRKAGKFLVYESPVWSSPSGKLLVVQAPVRVARFGAPSIYGVLRGGRLIPIPGTPASKGVAGYTSLAF